MIRPSYQETEGRRGVAVLFGVGERHLLALHVLEVRQPLEEAAQGVHRQRGPEQGPSLSLRLVASA